nr:MAG TPA: hypothetical protein [Caudoviricetes sp.]
MTGCGHDELNRLRREAVYPSAFAGTCTEQHVRVLG